MGKIVVGVSLDNDRTPLAAPVRVDAIVDTGANHLTLPLAWRERFGAFPHSRKVVVHTASHVVDGEICGPMAVAVEGFEQVSTEALFIPMPPEEDGGYAPLLGHIPLESCGALVDMTERKLKPAKYVDAKSIGGGMR